MSGIEWPSRTRAASPRQPKTATKPASAARHEVEERGTDGDRGDGDAEEILQGGAQIALVIIRELIMRKCDGSDETVCSEIVEGPWRHITDIRVESMHKLVTGGSAGA